jgi:hypothetical protein
LSPEEQYWCGYLRADGCIIRKPRGKIITFAQKVREPVDEFARFMGAPNPVRDIDRQSNFGRNILFQSSTARGAKELDDLGVKTALEPSLYLSKHFWRGLLDGDGSIAMSKNQGSLYPVVAWSGSLVDMESLCIWIENILGCKAPKIGKCRSIYVVAINSSKAKWLGLYLYKGEYACLAYKRDIALSFEKWDTRVKRSNAWQPPT